MKKIVFDIETVGQDFTTLDETSQEYFLRFADTEEKVEEAKNSLSFYPLTAQVVAVALLEVESDQGVVYFQNKDQEKHHAKEGPITYISATEAEILQHFWTQMKRYDQIVSFNGRMFDAPFLLLRSAINHIQATKNLMPYRYSTTSCHVDLADQMTFYDAMRRRFSLHMWCKAFGIKSSKEDGITGLQVKDLFQENRFLDIARYCMRDVQATKELFRYWETYLKF